MPKHILLQKDTEQVEKAVSAIHAYFPDNQALALLQSCVAGQNPFAKVAAQDPSAAASPAVQGLSADCKTIHTFYPDHKEAIERSMNRMAKSAAVGELAAISRSHK